MKTVLLLVSTVAALAANMFQFRGFLEGCIFLCGVSIALLIAGYIEWVRE